MGEYKSVSAYLYESAARPDLAKKNIEAIKKISHLTNRTINGLIDTIKNSGKSKEEIFAFLDRYSHQALYYPYKTEKMIWLYDNGFKPLIPVEAYMDPEFVKKCNINAIPDNFSPEDDEITSFTLLSQIKTIGYRAFKGCKNLTSIKIKDSAGNIVIKPEAFSKCQKLNSIKTKNHIDATIGQRAFLGCENLKQLALHVKGPLEKGVFMGCINLSALCFSDNAIQIGEYALYECASLKRLTGPDGGDVIIEYASEHSVAGCINLKAICLSSGITEPYAFEKCIGLNNIHIKEPLSEIEEGAFSDCMDIATISLEFPEYLFRNIKGYNWILKDTYAKHKDSCKITISEIK